MSNGCDLSLTIEAAGTAETLPLARLARYLAHLADLLGDQPSVHFVGATSGSVVLTVRVEPSAVDRVRQQLADVRDGTAAVPVLESYQALNLMVTEDGGVAVLGEGPRALLQFPGGNAAVPETVVSGLRQAGSLEGVIERVGGHGDAVLVDLRGPRETLIACRGPRDLAEQIGQALFTRVRLGGQGTWARSTDGSWSLQQFDIERITALNTVTFAQTVADLRRIPAVWLPNPLEVLGALSEQAAE